jgi:cysteinyl-tRNA synthetase
VQHLNDKSGKMSKSKGDFLTVSLLESKGYNPLVYRFFCLQSHYRKPLLFTYDVLDNAKTAYEKLLKRVASLNPQGEPDMDAVNQYRDAFAEAMGSDINTSQALTVLYDVLKGDSSDATKRYLVEDFDRVFSLDLTKQQENDSADEELTKFVEQKIALRKEARQAKDFAKADAIRQELLERGIEIKDTREGTIWSTKA